MKIISKKEWEKINQTMVYLQLDLDDEIRNLKIKCDQVELLQQTIEEEKKVSVGFAKVIDSDAIIIEEQKATIKKLKTLLTKNKIDYKSVLEKRDKNVATSTNKTRKTTRKTK